MAVERSLSTDNIQSKRVNSEAVVEELSAIDDMVGLYLQEISRTPLLSAEQEVSLAKRIEKGKTAHKLLEKKDGELNQTEKILLNEQVEDASSARDHLVSANTSLVVSFAKRDLNKGLPFLDIVQEGNIGLMIAAEGYDYRRGNRFSTYASWLIMYNIQKGIKNNDRNIRLPIKVHNILGRLYETSDHLERELGRKPTLDEIASRMGLEVNRVEKLISVSELTYSLDAPRVINGRDEFETLVVDESELSMGEATDLELLRKHLESAVSVLEPKEVKILRLRYGMEDGESHTLEEIGQEFGLTRERIRQIEVKALSRLRYGRNSHTLAEFLT